jgi:hypothetical protein
MNTVSLSLFLAGALALAGEATVHVQQYFALFHDVPWIGPLFLANAVACAVVIAGLADPRTRDLAALAGVATSAIALASLIVSYGQGLFGWHEAGFRPIIELTVIFELAAIVLLSAALAAASSSPRFRVQRGISGSWQAAVTAGRFTPDRPAGAQPRP